MSKQSKTKTRVRRRKRQKARVPQGVNVKCAQEEQDNELRLLCHALLSHLEMQYFLEDIKHSSVFHVQGVSIRCLGPDASGLEIVRIYTCPFFDELVTHILEEGWMSERWKDQFAYI